MQRDQFLRINNTKPLPRGLVTELLPKISTPLPPRLSVRKIPSALCDLLNSSEESPFRGLIRRPSARQGPSARARSSPTPASIQALKESLTSPSGCLFPYRNLSSGETDFTGIWSALVLYWTAVKDTFPQAWGKPPAQSRLMHGAGIRAMGRLMDRIMGSIDARQPGAADQVRRGPGAAGPALPLDRGPVGRAGHALERDPERAPAHPRTVQLPDAHLPAGPGGAAMKFFFPDSQDQIDPAFDFITEERSPLRVRQRDDLYLHEALRAHVIDGLLVSKAIVDGLPGAAGKYTLAQRHRLYRAGCPAVLPPRRRAGPAAWRRWATAARSATSATKCRRTRRTRSSTSTPSAASTSASRSTTSSSATTRPPTRALVTRRSQEWAARQQLTLDLAAEFLARCRTRKSAFEPVGVAQGWSPASYAQGSRRTAEDRLHADRGRRHGPPEDPRDPRLPAADQHGPRPRHPVAPPGHHPLRQHGRIRRARGHQFRQHLGVPAGIQGRQGQLPHPGPDLHRAARPPGGRQPQAQGAHPGWPTDPSVTRSEREQACLQLLRDYDCGNVDVRHVAGRTG